MLTEIEDFLQAVASKGCPRAQLKDAIRTLELVQSIQSYLKEHPTIPV
jgi:hypothetical protein